MKDETRAPSTESNPSGPFEFGTFVDNGHGGRKRKRDPHIDDAELVKKLMLEGKTRFDIIMLYPHFADRYRSLFDHMELHIAGLKQRETTLVFLSTDSMSPLVIVQSGRNSGPSRNR